MLCLLCCVSTYVIFLSLQFLAEVELLGLQLHHPLPELIGLLSARTNQKLRQWTFPHHQRFHIMFSGDLLQFIFRQMIDVEWLPPLGQDLPLLLSLRLFLRPLAALALPDKIDGV